MALWMAWVQEAGASASRYRSFASFIFSDICSSGGIMGSLPLILHHPWCYVEGVESTLLRQSLICFVLDNTWRYVSICDISAICSLSVTLGSMLPLSFLYVYTPVLFFWMLFVPGDDLISPQRCVLQACSHP